MGLPEDLKKMVQGRRGLQQQTTAGLANIFGGLGALPAFTAGTDSSTITDFAVLPGSTPAPRIQESSIAYQPSETHNRLENEYEWLRRRIREVMWEPN